MFIKLELDFTDKDRLGFEGNAMAKEKGFSRDNRTLKGSGLLILVPVTPTERA